ncbi:MAG: spermidine/putrescine ABC transporter substrate-binding protein [Clostridia bacterium]|nr:spermidine/putrescine ABC transporter substrate-binding protein [Clostridia bacterium]
MKKLLSILLSAALLIALAATVCAEEEPKMLNVFTWDEYIDYDTILAPFFEETGIRVNYSTFGSNEEMLAKMEATGGEGYDLVLASDYVLDALRLQGLIQPLDKSKLPNFVNIKDACLGQYYDPDSAFVVPYVIGTPLIVYDPVMTGFEITGIEDLWNPALKDNVVIIDDARVVIAHVLKTMGHSFNTADPDILAQAAEKLSGLRPNIRVFDYDTPHVAMASGETAAGFMFTPQVVWARMDRPDLQVVYPKEGLGIGIDGLVISAKAPHPGNAHLLLDFLLRPEIALEIAAVQLYSNANEAAESMLPEIFLTEPSLNVPAESLADAEFLQFLGEDEALYQDIWLTFKQQ